MLGVLGLGLEFLHGSLGLGLCPELRHGGASTVEGRAERARERVQRRTELRKRYEAKLSLESESTQQEKEEAKNYERRIKDLQRIEAKERIYKMELEESERISKQELRQHQASL